MKLKFILLLSILFLNFSVAKSQKITFLESEHDFGQIEENGGNVSHTFEFINE